MSELAKFIKAFLLIVGSVIAAIVVVLLWICLGIWSKTGIWHCDGADSLGDFDRCGLGFEGYPMIYLILAFCCCFALGIVWAAYEALSKT